MKAKPWTMQSIIEKGLTVTGGAGKIIDLPQEKKSKYGNKKVQIDGIVFDSKKEGERWSQLKLLERMKQITELKHHQKFEMIVEGMLICKYEADFTYRKNDVLIVEDVKSDVTKKLPVYRLKLKLLKALHGIEITEI